MNWELIEQKLFSKLNNNNFDGVQFDYVRKSDLKGNDLRNGDLYADLIEIRNIKSKNLRLISFQPIAENSRLNPYYGGKDVLAEGLLDEISLTGESAIIYPDPRTESHFQPNYIKANEKNYPVVTNNIKQNSEIFKAKKNILIDKYNKNQDFLKKFRITLDEFAAAYNIWDSYRPNILHNHYARLPHLTAMFSTFDNRKIIKICHNHPPDIASSYDLYDCLVFNTERHLKYALKGHESIEQQCEVIHPGVTDSYMGKCISELDNYFVFVGTFRHGTAYRKGIDILFKAYSTCLELQLKTRLVIVGGGPELTHYIKIAQDYNLPFEFFGDLTSSEVCDILDKALGLVVPSRKESFGLVYLESICRGTPIIGFKPTVDELSEILGGFIGYSFEGEDHSLLSELMLKLFKLDSCQRRSLMEIGYEAQNKFGFSVENNKYLELFYKLYEKKFKVEARRPVRRESFLVADEKLSAKSKSFYIHNKKSKVGQPCIVVGMGPSLKMYDLEKTKHIDSFASNKIYLGFPDTTWRPKYYFVEDPTILDNNLSDINSNIPCEPVTYRFAPSFAVTRQNRFVPNSSILYNVIEEKNFAPAPPKFSSDPVKGFYWGATVSFSMLQMAAYLGYTKIILIGMDNSYDLIKAGSGLSVSSTNSHFHPNYYSENDKWNDPRVNLKTLSFISARNYFSKLGVEVINCTRGGELEVFKRECIEDYYL